ncbi:conserved hypothetical protein [Abyssogena phaseoliformis symbiont OG214]|nr:hypothetical protein [Candidatus Ruthia sp. Apha_13_S6]BBB22859.1 conserved hypothetical protein [Abyssogena phaseoliformis symbiont OG214]
MTCFALFLSSCSTLNIQPIKLAYQQTLPSVWEAHGRLSVSINNDTKTSGFEVSFNHHDYKLILSTALGFGQISIEFNQQKLLVNDKLINLMFNQWMMSEMGWYLPIDILAKILFKNEINSTRLWQTKISRYQLINGIQYPKVIRFNHLTKPIKIKLLINEVNQLK